MSTHNIMKGHQRAPPRVLEQREGRVTCLAPPGGKRRDRHRRVDDLTVSCSPRPLRTAHGPTAAATVRGGTNTPTLSPLRDRARRTELPRSPPLVLRAAVRQLQGERRLDPRLAAGEWYVMYILLFYYILL